MRTHTDALRSVKRYLAEILEPHPPLAELWWTNGTITLRWTIHEQVRGCRNLEWDAWAWLLDQSRHTPLPTGTPEVPTSYYRRSQLISDPRPAAVLAGFTLPASGPTLTVDRVINEPIWEIRHWFDRGEIPNDRPYARVHAVLASGTSGGALYYDVTQPMAIECYPQPLESAQASLLRAHDVLDELERGFQQVGVGAGRPLRIPLYDYDGVADGEGSTKRHENDFLRVLNFSGRTLPDPQDPRRVAVMADLRIGWRRSTDLRELRDRNDVPVRGTRQVESVTTAIEAS